MSTPRQLLTTCTQCFIYERRRTAEEEEGQAIAAVVMLGAWSVLSRNINEHNEEDREQRSSISKQLGHFKRQIDGKVDGPFFLLTAAQIQLIRL